MNVCFQIRPISAFVHLLHGGVVREDHKGGFVIAVGGVPITPPVVGEENKRGLENVAARLADQLSIGTYIPEDAGYKAPPRQKFEEVVDPHPGVPLSPGELLSTVEIYTDGDVLEHTRWYGGTLSDHGLSA